MEHFSLQNVECGKHVPKGLANVTSGCFSKTPPGLRLFLYDQMDGVDLNFQIVVKTSNKILGVYDSVY